MSSNKLIELSNLVFSVKEKLTDGEYKNMMDKLGEIHNININTINVNIRDHDSVSTYPNNPPPQEVKINITDYKIEGVNNIDEVNQYELYYSLTEEQKDYFISLGFYHAESEDIHEYISNLEEYYNIDYVNEIFIEYSELAEQLEELLTDGDAWEGLKEEKEDIKTALKNAGYIKAIEEVKEELIFDREIKEEERKRIKNNRECPKCHKKDYDRIITPEYMCNICYEKLLD